MLDEQGQKNLSKNIHNLWIQPELDKRFKDTGIPTGFKIWQALIKLPKHSSPIVEFNDEIEWKLKFKVPDYVEVKEGQIVYLHEVESVISAEAPTVDEIRVAYIYLYWNGISYQVLFNFSPNQSDYDPDNHSFEFDGEVIAEHVNNILREKAARISQNHLNELRKIGLWTATALLPYPISKILERLEKNDLDGAMEVLVDHCDIEFLTNQIVETWYPICVFSERMSFFGDALFCHSNGKYHASISTLVGQVEGVITDWLYEIDHYKVDKARSIPAKIKDFRAVLSQIPDLLWTYKEGKDSMLDFLDGDPWLQTFNEWMIYGNTSFAGRHVVQHGKYDHALYTEENSIKLFLLLDNICQFMMFYEARVLGRDIGQNKLNEEYEP